MHNMRTSKSSKFEDKNGNVLGFTKVQDYYFDPIMVIPGVTFSELAKGVNRSVAQISRIFGGTRYPSYPTLCAMARFLTKRGDRRYTVGDVVNLINNKPWRRARNERRRKIEREMKELRTRTAEIRAMEREMSYTGSSLAGAM